MFHTLELRNPKESQNAHAKRFEEMQHWHCGALLYCVEGLHDAKATDMANAIVASLIELDQYLKPKSGTKEWADVNVNILTGCSHNCRYCYAHQTARQYKRCKGDWAVRSCATIGIALTNTTETSFFNRPLTFSPSSWTSQCRQ